MQVVAFGLALSLVACGAILGPSADDLDPPIRDDGGGGETSTPGSDASSDGDEGETSTGRDGGVDGALDAAKDGAGSRTEKYVFISSERYAGNFGSRADADLVCKSLATMANTALFGSSTWKAYLAAGNGAAASVRMNPQPYVRFVDKKLVFAQGWTANPAPVDFIAFDEKGQNLMAVLTKQVWTGVANAVLAKDRTCEDWTMGAGKFGGFGDLQNLADWQNVGGATAGCESTYRIYCFED